MVAAAEQRHVGLKSHSNSCQNAALRVTVQAKHAAVYTMSYTRQHFNIKAVEG